MAIAPGSVITHRQRSTIKFFIGINHHCNLFSVVRPELAAVGMLMAKSSSFIGPLARVGNPLSATLFIASSIGNPTICPFASRRPFLRLSCQSRMQNVDLPFWIARVYQDSSHRQFSTVPRQNLSHLAAGAPEVNVRSLTLPSAQAPVLFCPCA